MFLMLKNRLFSNKLYKCTVSYADRAMFAGLMWLLGLAWLLFVPQCLIMLPALRY